MNHGSLFTGSGGFDLAAHWMGWTNVFNCELEEYNRNLLKQYWPNAIQYGDIKSTDFRPWRGRIDILTGGDPCQVSSYAGKRKGKEDDRYLWPEYRRAIEEIQPRFVLNENVTGSITNGILDQKISDLEALGYAWWPPLVIPAAAVGALHRRDRVWLFADSIRNEQPREESCNGQAGRVGRQFEPLAWNDDWENMLSNFRGMDDGLSHKVDRTDGMRNAICPQIAYELFKAIEQYEITVLK